MEKSEYIEEKLKKWQNAEELSNYKLYELNYKNIKDNSLKKFFTMFHSLFFWHFEKINRATRNRHYWADDSRRLIEIIEEYYRIESSLISSDYYFEMNDYYKYIIQRCAEFLRQSGGSPLPDDFEKIVIIDDKPMFEIEDIIIAGPSNMRCKLVAVGGGSYASVHKYKDAYYKKYFAIKKAKKSLDDKERVRFKREFDEMNKMSSPYVLEVYNFNEEKHEYTMEYADFTLHDYISDNGDLSKDRRVGLVRQVFRGIEYIHNTGILHRDISLTNVLIKKYDDVCVIKISDFGLLKHNNSSITSMNTEFKGSLNDPKLDVFGGFSNYLIQHETYALTRLIYFIMTGKKQIDLNIKSSIVEFVRKGLADDLDERFKSVREMRECFDNLL